MAESILFGIATHVLNKLGSVAYQEGSLCWGFKSDLVNLQKTMSTIQAVLVDAEQKQSKDNRLRLWLADLKDVFYDAEDVLDEMECEDFRRQLGGTHKKVIRFFSSSNPAVLRIKIGHKIKGIKERLNEIGRDKSSFGLTESVEVRHVIPIEKGMTHSFVRAPDVIGRDDDKENIIEYLTRWSESDAGNISVIPIVAIGGMGKTAVAKIVYNDKRVDEIFDLKMWVCVPDDFDLTRLMKEIINSATGDDNCATLSNDQLQQRLRGTLDDKKFLLTLDDVWNENLVKWNELRELLIGGAVGSKIVVTTRSHRVASIMGTTPTHVLRGLPHEDCLALFKKWAFKEGDEKRYPNLVKIGDEIVKRCKGLPLAVTTLGSLLYTKTDERDWLKIKDNEIWKLEQEEKDVLPVLKLSYDHLPSHLQRCFAYCSLYPKDHVFSTNKLVSEWMAIGLLATRNEKEELEDVGFRYCKELLSRCFFQDFEDYGFYCEFKMHDLIHDLAVSMAQGEYWRLNLGTMDVDKNVRHFSFTDTEYKGQKVPEFLVNKSRSVRTIRFNGLKDSQFDDATSFVNTCIRKFKSLRYLDLRRLSLQMLPDSIGALKHLRSLDLSYNDELKELPESICELHNLQSLWLHGCTSLKKLPDNVQNMNSLRYLSASMSGMDISINGIRGLSSLRYLWLNNFGKPNLESLFASGIQSLTALQTLCVTRSNNLVSLPAGMKYLTRLENMYIWNCKNLNMKMELQGEDIRLSLRSFTIIELESLLDLPQLILEGSAKTLQYMKIHNCPRLVALPEWLQNLTSLQKLKIQGCRGLSSLPEGMERLTALRELRIKDCPTLVESCKQDMSKISHIPEIHLKDGGKALTHSFGISTIAGLR